MPLKVRPITSKNLVKPHSTNPRVTIKTSTKKRSPTWYKDNVNSKNYKFRQVSRVTYRDGFATNGNHFALCDKHNDPQAVIGYKKQGETIAIQFIQTTQYKSKQQNQEFRNIINMHISEFLLCEFIRKFQKNDRKIILELDKGAIGTYMIDTIYKPLISRFFKHSSSSKWKEYYELNLNSERVKTLLEL